MKTSTCKGCGARIIWIRTANGKQIPCDPERIPYRTDLHNGDLKLIDPVGRLCVGFLDVDSDRYGYVSHFATCPVAGKFRKINQKSEQITISYE